MAAANRANQTCIFVFFLSLVFSAFCTHRGPCARFVGFDARSFSAWRDFLLAACFRRRKNICKPCHSFLIETYLRSERRGTSSPPPRQRTRVPRPKKSVRFRFPVARAERTERASRFFRVFFVPLLYRCKYDDNKRTDRTYLYNRTSIQYGTMLKGQRSKGRFVIGEGEGRAVRTKVLSVGAGVGKVLSGVTICAFPRGFRTFVIGGDGSQPASPACVDRRLCVSSPPNSPPHEDRIGEARARAHRHTVGTRERTATLRVQS